MILVPSNLVSAGAALWVALFASTAGAEVSQRAIDAEIVVVGEQHDNPDHHARQAEWVATLAPKALVFEMLTEQQAMQAQTGWTSQEELDVLIGWSASAWPSFDMYFPIFSAAPDARIYGANIPRTVLRAQLEIPINEQPSAIRFGFDIASDEDEQSKREAGQAAAHCGALPDEMLPIMVNAQRLRDASLADAALRALKKTGGPVVVITGNGHARTDWGVPALIARVAPEVSLFSLGQSEDGHDVRGTFSAILDAPAPTRDDPCAAFTQ